MKIFSIYLNDNTFHQTDFNGVTFETWGIKFYNTKEKVTMYIPWTSIKRCDEEKLTET